MLIVDLQYSNLADQTDEPPLIRSVTYALKSRRLSLPTIALWELVRGWSLSEHCERRTAIAQWELSNESKPARDVRQDEWRLLQLTLSLSRATPTVWCCIARHIFIVSGMRLG